MEEPVQYSYLRPSQFRERLQQLPLAYLPLGTLEWHGEHLPLGADSLQSEALMIQAAEKFGGIVLPPLFLGPDRRMDREDGSYIVGMDYAKSTSPHQQLPGSAYWVSDDFFIQLLENILGQLKRAGFKAVFAHGHGPSRKRWCENIPRWEQQFGLNLKGITDEEKDQWDFMNDHAARNETSIMLYTHPGLTDLSVFEQGEDSPLLGVNGVHPFTATADVGETSMQRALQLLGQWIQSF